jgi:hypothetical protein
MLASRLFEAGLLLKAIERLKKGRLEIGHSKESQTSCGPGPAAGRATLVGAGKMLFSSLIVAQACVWLG